MPKLSFCLAVLWLTFAAGLLAWHAATGDPRLRLPVGGSDLSLGWAALALGLYNLLRWWGAWSYQRQRREMQASWARRDEQARRARGPGPEPDPNFVFTDPPAGGAEGRPPR